MVVGLIAAIDTNIFISVVNKEKGYAQSTKKVLDWIDEGKIKGIVSTIVLAEICSGYDTTQQQESKKERDDFLAHVLGSSNYEIADVTVPVALDGGNLRSKEGFKLPDALIIASALRYGAEYLISNDEPVGKGGRRAAVLPDDLKVLSAAEFVKVFKETNSRKESEIRR